MLRCEKTIHASRTSVILILPDMGSCGQFSCQERIFLPVLAFMETYSRPVGFWTSFPFLQKVAMVPRQQLRTDEPPVASCRDFVRVQAPQHIFFGLYRNNGSDIKLCNQIQMKGQM